jgi:RNA polymerase primary sigma factor
MLIDAHSYPTLSRSGREAEEYIVQKYQGKDLQSLVDLGREQGYLTFDQVNALLPQDVTSPADLRAALDSFEDVDIKLVNDVPAEESDGELEAEVEVKEEPDDSDEAASAADAISPSSDPIRLYLKEMAAFPLLSREQEVEIAKRIETGENEVEDEVLRSPVTLDLAIQMGERVEAGEANLHDIFAENEHPADADDDEEGREAHEKQLKQLFAATAKLKSLRSRIDDIEKKLKHRSRPVVQAQLEKSLVQLKHRVKRELHQLELSPHLQEAVISEMRRLFETAHDAQTLIQHYERATGCSKSQLLHEAAEKGRPQMPKINGRRENLLDIATRIEEAQKTVRQVEHRVKATTDELAHSIRNDRIGSGQEPPR